MATRSVLAASLLLLGLALASAGSIPVDQQCGGIGGVCQAVGECKDAPWTKRTCADGLGCGRISKWHWQCVEGPTTDPNTFLNGPIAIDQQCGGAGGDCDLINECADAAWTKRTCATGLTCGRIHRFHWQCMAGATPSSPVPSIPSSPVVTVPSSPVPAVPSSPVPAVPSSPVPAVPSPAPATGTIAIDQQCGGKGGVCTSLGECIDAPWTKRTCAAGLRCGRIHAFHWQCMSAATPSSPAPVTTGPIAIDQQCGGMGGECTANGECKDAPWSKRKCTGKLACVRISAFHYQCMVPVDTKAPIAIDQQCGGKGGICPAVGECKDAAWSKRKCATGLRCGRIHAFHWQCMAA